jgi:hypothetical protein
MKRAATLRAVVVDNLMTLVGHPAGLDAEAAPAFRAGAATIAFADPAPLFDSLTLASSSPPLCGGGRFASATG